MASVDSQDEGLKWQVGVWDRMSLTYLREVDARFTGVIDGVIQHSRLRPGQQVLDLGTGTGSVAIRAAPLVVPGGTVTAIDISPEMLATGRKRIAGLGLSNISFREGRAEQIPVLSGQFEAVLASLSLMYVIDRDAAAREIARVLRPGGCFVAAVWGGPEAADIVLFQQLAGSFAPRPPVPGVGPGALSDPSEFVQQLERAGMRARVEIQTTEFSFEDFSLAWAVLAAVTTAQLPAERQEEAKAAVRAKMWSSSFHLRDQICHRNSIALDRIVKKQSEQPGVYSIGGLNRCLSSAKSQMRTMSSSQNRKCSSLGRRHRRGASISHRKKWSHFASCDRTGSFGAILRVPKTRLRRIYWSRDG